MNKKKKVFRTDECIVGACYEPPAAEVEIPPSGWAPGWRPICKRHIQLAKDGNYPLRELEDKP